LNKRKTLQSKLTWQTIALSMLLLLFNVVTAARGEDRENAEARVRLMPLPSSIQRSPGQAARCRAWMKTNPTS
jgi:hypothetical protein